MFKVGDKVICTGMNSGYNHKLVVGGKYTIAEVSNNWVYIRENNKLDCYSSKYFILESDRMTMTNMDKELYDLETMGYRT